MKTLKKILKWTGIFLVLVILFVVIWSMTMWDQKFEAPLPDIHATSDSAVIAHGKYLVYGPAHCADCHTNLADFEKKERGEEVPLAGGFEFKLPFGSVFSRNLTNDETGIKNITDPEIARVLRYGVMPDGKVVLDFMAFHNTSDEDLTAIISYLRSMPPVKREIPADKWNFIGKLILSTMITPVGPDGEVPKSVTPDTTAVYGKYLATSIANCKGCHTNRDLKTGKFIGEPYAGGFKMDDPNYPNTYFVSRNLTPDPETGHIYSWSEAQFINRFRQGKLIAGSPMPWGPFGNFSDNDLKAIYSYLKTLAPIKNDPGPSVQKIEE